MHHCYIGLPQHRIPLCHNGSTACFFGAICGIKPITSLTRNAQNGLLTGSTLGSVTDSFSYNTLAELTRYSASYISTELYSAAYSRDALSRITQKVEIVGGVVATYGYGYDAAGRLSAVTKNANPFSSYSYDSNGNRTARTGPSLNASYDAQDRLTSYGNTTYSYTANGELLSKTTGGQTTSYQYDALGNLLKVTLPGGGTIDYLIDGSNRRIGKKVNGNLIQAFLHQGSLRPVAELDSSNAVVSRFVYATHINVPDYMVKGGTTYRIITDQLGSPRLVVDVTMGAVVQRIDYDEFGKVLSDSNPGFQPFGFAGGLYDRDTKLVRFGARDYDAEIGKWAAKDPIGFKGGDTNLYRYVYNDPINLVDLTGRFVTGGNGLEPADVALTTTALPAAAKLVSNPVIALAALNIAIWGKLGYDLAALVHEWDTDVVLGRHRPWVRPQSCRNASPNPYREPPVPEPERFPDPVPWIPVHVPYVPSPAKPDRFEIHPRFKPFDAGIP